MTVTLDRDALYLQPLAFGIARNLRDGFASDRERLLVQAFKVQEEAGELAEAVINMCGFNPRKGITSTLGDVVREACDVALTALVFLENNATPGRSLSELEARMVAVAARLAPSARDGQP